MPRWHFVSMSVFGYQSQLFNLCVYAKSEFVLLRGSARLAPQMETENKMFTSSLTPYKVSVSSLAPY
ncbi:hypothetical protein SRHO_G00131850 [Serrasalmus rhombeus]